MFIKNEQNKYLNKIPLSVHNTHLFNHSERRPAMNKSDASKLPLNPQVSPHVADLIRGAIHAAQKRTSINLSSIDPPSATRHGATNNARITLDLNGVAQQYDVEARLRLRARGELEIIGQWGREPAIPTLLVVPHLTPALAEECVERDLQFIDLAGNMHLHAPGQYMLVIGRGAGEEVKRLKRATGQAVTSANASALRMIFALLCEPSLLNRSYREIAAAAGIALGTVGPVLDDLRERRLLTGKDGRHGRRFLDPERLRDEWVTNYPLRLLPKLNAQRFTAQDPSWWESAEIPAGKAWWGAEIAASRLTRQLRPITQTLYVDPDARQDVTLALVRRHRLRADPSGPIEILDAFWRLGETSRHQDTAPALLVYADLIRTREPRNLEAAALIQENGTL
jgi:hypothetical protein